MITVMKYNFFALLTFPLLGCYISKEIEKERRFTQIVLVGATGDLAKKYLWSGLFSLYCERNTPDEMIKVYGAARMEYEKGKNHLKNILDSTLNCNKDKMMKDCGQKIGQFKEQVKYYGLKTDAEYRALCDDLNGDIPRESKAVGRIFYLSVPPSAYSAIAKNINMHCRPSNNGRAAYIRVILEKPFGSDLASARNLAQDLQQFFKEKEIYRIDHYLGKTGVSQILKFRDEHRSTFGSLWNRNHIEDVEIALKEKGDCRGRTRFYNEYGVIRDVIQNHMTELLALVAMETPNDINNVSEVHQNKIAFLKSIKRLHAHSAVTGQYKDYVKQCESDHDGVVPSSYKTPTFAAVLLYLKNSKWDGVPFVMLSGKQLEERTAYVSITFKKKFTMKSSSDNCLNDKLIFHIQGGSLKGPALIVSKGLPFISEFSDWKPVISKPHFLYGCPGESFKVFEPLISHDAYSALIKAAYLGRQDLFIGTEDLIASWEIWTPLLDSLESSIPRIYSKDNLETLDFSIIGQRLEFSHLSREESCSVDGLGNERYGTERFVRDVYKQPFIRGSLVTGSSNEVAMKLAQHLLQQASTAVSRTGVFHLALSGGSSPLALFNYLAFFSPEFPWHDSHIWLVDERCKPLTNEQSNFRFIYENLLQYIPLPKTNIHPMPVSLKNGLCVAEDNGCNHYEAELKRVLGNRNLDFVLLGLGTDGHTASLFPGSDSLFTSNWVALTESKLTQPLGLRMTMTYSIINKAKSIAVFILGEKKAGIVQKIANAKHIDRNVGQIPIFGINPQTNMLSWYIDDKALGKIN